MTLFQSKTSIGRCHAGGSLLDVRGRFSRGMRKISYAGPEVIHQAKRRMARPAHIGVCSNRMSPPVLFDYLENSVDPLTPLGPDEFKEDPVALEKSGPNAFVLHLRRAVDIGRDAS